MNKTLVGMLLVLMVGLNSWQAWRTWSADEPSCGQADVTSMDRTEAFLDKQMQQAWNPFKDSRRVENSLHQQARYLAELSKASQLSR